MECFVKKMLNTKLKRLIVCVSAVVALTNAFPTWAKEPNKTIKTDSIEDRVSRLERMVNNLGTRVPARVTTLSPTDNGLQVITDGVGIIGISIADIKAIGDGSEMTLEAINFLGVALVSLKFSMEVFVKDEYGYTLNQTVEFDISKIKEGSATKKKIRLSGVKPSDLYFVGIKYISTASFIYTRAK